jgi:L-ascorbate metabolism protein UlaG (beta-lactamase superfamily)
MVRIELLPAAHGDAIWIEYGKPTSPRRIVIDGGPAPTYQQGLRARVLALPAAERRLDLFVVTHIDADHIDGAILLLREADRLAVKIDELWFNGWRQLGRDGPAVYAPLQGEFLGGVIQLTPALRRALNRTFRGGAAQAPATGDLRTHDLPDGARLTLLSPTENELTRLRARWASAIRDFAPGDAQAALKRLEERREYRPPEAPAVFGAKSFGDDRSVANGSSIAFLLEAEGVSVLLAGDAHARVLASSLRRLAAQRGVARIRVDAVKLPHHGSMSNVSEDLLAVLDAERWLYSTNGDIFDHPDVETARLISASQPRPVTMLFNYDVTSTRRLASAKPRPAAPAWRAQFFSPERGAPPMKPGLTLTLSAPRPAAVASPGRTRAAGRAGKAAAPRPRPRRAGGTR